MRCGYVVSMVSVLMVCGVPQIGAMHSFKKLKSEKGFSKLFLERQKLLKKIENQTKDYGVPWNMFKDFSDLDNEIIERLKERSTKKVKKVKLSISDKELKELERERVALTLKCVERDGSPHEKTRSKLREIEDKLRKVKSSKF